METTKLLAPRVADVCLVLEGTYPYVAGGVSSWVHEIVAGLPALGFALLHIGPRAGAYGTPCYETPTNVTGLHEMYCADGTAVAARAEIERSIRAARRNRSATKSRTLEALRRLHLESTVDDALIEGLAAADLSVEGLLHGAEAFELICEIARVRAPDAPFVTLFWHFRSMHVPLLRLLSARSPDAHVYHSVSTGYAGVVAAAASCRHQKPLLLTEHGIYSRERDMELARAQWDDTGATDDPRLPTTTSQLRGLWSRFFARLAQIAYYRADRIVTLSDVNRRRQVEDGATAAKITIVPNGVDVDPITVRFAPSKKGKGKAKPLRVGFVGRVVPIKDVVTFIKACDRALHDVSLQVEIIGPCEEDPAYVRRCRELVTMLGREDEIVFVGSRKSSEIYKQLDVCVLTSFSEGQPLVILEAQAAGIPVISTDVGACREMLEGGEADRALGPSGIVTAVSAPDETAAALIALARNPERRRKLGDAGKARVRARYGKAKMIDTYRDFYTALGAGRE